MKNRHTRLVVLWAAACADGVDGGVLDPTHEGLVINELMAHNTATLQDATGAWPDWIELYNPTRRNISLSGAFLTDEHADPFQHYFSADAPVIAAGGFSILFADEDVEQGPAHLAFAIDSDGGEDVALFGSVSEGLPTIDAVFDLPPMDPDHAYARAEDGTWGLTDTPTPGEENER